MASPRLFVGPMSKEIVDFTIEYSNSKKTKLGLIPSRRQIEDTGGYVNNWKTKDFVNYVRQGPNNVLLVRDHGGPLQGAREDSGIESLMCDINNSFDILHIDPWKNSKNINDGIQQTLEIIENVCLNNETVKFEVGTEAAIFPYTEAELTKMLKELKNSLGSDFSRISHAVVQSGVQIVGTENIGIFDSRRLEKMVNIIHDFGVLTKEHNGDYLSGKQIRTRALLGLDAINIAPEFGVTQTKLLLDTVFDADDFLYAYSVCETSKKYIKWIDKDLRDAPQRNKKLIVEVSGHYVFTEEPFRSHMQSIKNKFKKVLFARFDDILGAWKA